MYDGKNFEIFENCLENLPKYLHINFQIWFPKYKFKNSKYIKNVEVQSQFKNPCSNACIDVKYKTKKGRKKAF